MTSKEKLIALQKIKDMQGQIESFEDAWNKAYRAGKPAEELEKMDSAINQLMARRNGMFAMLAALNVKVSRTDYRDSNDALKVHTEWYLL